MPFLYILYFFRTPKRAKKHFWSKQSESGMKVVKLWRNLKL